MPSRPVRRRTLTDDLIGALAALNRSIPLADELADGVQALENVRSGRAGGLRQGWDQARAASGAAARGFETAHPYGGQLVRGAGLAVQAAPFLMTGGASAAPVAAARPGLLERLATGAALGGLGAQVGGLTGEGDLRQRAAAANAATPAGTALGAAVPLAATAAGAGVRAATRQQPPKPVSALTGQEVAPLDASLQDLRAAARSYFNAELRGRTVPMGGPEGPLVGFNRTGREKAISFSSNPDKLRAFPALPDVIGRGRVVSEPPIKDVDPRVKGFHIVDAPIEIDGKLVPMRVVVREMVDGHYHYDHAVRSGEGPATSPGEPSLGRPAAGTPATKHGLPLQGARTLNPNMGVDPRSVNEPSLVDRLIAALSYGQGAAQGR